MVNEAIAPDEETDVNYRIAILYGGYDQFIRLSSQISGNSWLGKRKLELFSTADELMDALENGFVVDVILASTESGGWELLRIVRSSRDFANVPVILLASQLSRELVQKARAQKADDIFEEDLEGEDLQNRLEFLFRKKHYQNRKAAERVQQLHVKTPLWKRAIDVAVVGTALLILSPLFIIVALVIRLDSKGPIFYFSKRVGSGYKIFNLYKFRTMRTNADQMIKNMATMNIYNRPAEQQETNTTLCNECQLKGIKTCERLLFWDGKEICERIYNQEKEQKAAFMKFQNDPRITGVGRFLRNTSIDELPQLVNILKGDMSLVGNRPLPLYEAEKLTTDDKILRFAGPAGLTGYWQVTKRSKKKAEITEQERIELDIYYVKNFSFLLDMKIILKTFPALFQSETV
jgi:lipopolysaccharide/colanic/teichoic acid biosynthesis glycosyltransferase